MLPKRDVGIANNNKASKRLICLVRANRMPNPIKIAISFLLICVWEFEIVRIR